MPEATAPAGAKRTAGGFTLIELVVVLLLIGLTVSFATLSIGGQSPRERQHEAAQAIKARMALAREEAVVRGETYGVRFADNGYRFYARGDGRWRALSGDQLFADQTLPGPVSVDVTLDGVGVILETDSAESDGEAPDPQIFFLPGGELVPGYTVRVRSDRTDREFHIRPGDRQWVTLREEPA